MSNFPPHLPPRSSNVAQHHRWQATKVIMVSLCFGLFAGLVGASMALGWIWPTLGQGDAWVIARSHTNSRTLVDEASQSQASETIFSVYKRTTLVGATETLDPADRLTEGVVITGEGWLIGYLPDYDKSFQNWRVIGRNGTVYSVSQVIFDERSGFIYFKITSPGLNTFLAVSPKLPATLVPEHFRSATVGSVPDNNGVVFINQQRSWYTSFVAGRGASLTPSSHLDSLSITTFSLNGSWQRGAVVVNDQGAVVGLVGDSGLTGGSGTVLIPISIAFSNSTFLSSAEASGSRLNNSGRVTYPSLGVEGWSSDERPVIVNGQSISGFVVNKVLIRLPKSNQSGSKQVNQPVNQLQKGDIITAINNRLVNFTNIWYNRGQSSVRLQVLRNGKTIDLEASVVEI